jgi:hypothetical protein
MFEPNNERVEGIQNVHPRSIPEEGTIEKKADR